jgi:hypothetical protein
MKSFIIVATVLGFLSAGRPVNAESGPDAKGMLDQCMLSPGPHLECKAYVRGLMAGILAGQTSTDHRLCFPDDLTADQATTVINVYIYSHAEYWKLNGEAVALMALLKRFPCEK